MTELFISLFAACCRSALFGVVLLGVGSFLYQVFRPEWQFAPVLTVSCISLLIYAAGLLNFMPLTTVGLVLFGLYQAILQLKKVIHKKPSVRKLSADIYRWYPMFFFAALILYIFYYARGGRYPDGDTMTHWGVIVREMCETNRLPNFSSAEVSYQSYPPGTACFLYFACAVAGYHESVTMIAQALMLFSCLLTPFALVKRKNCCVQYVVLTVFAVYAMQFNITLDDLKVDNLLSLITFAAICIILFYWAEPRKALWASAPVLCLLMLIKNSGPIYYLFALVLLTGMMRSTARSQRPYRIFWCCAVAAPLGTLYLWNSHIKMVFANAAGTRHSTDISAMVQIFESRSKEELLMICDNFFALWFRPVLGFLSNHSGEWPAVLILTILVLCALGTRKYHAKNILRGYIGVLTGYVLYKFCLLGMYLFNMPDEDALGIGAYARYTASITILLYGLSALLAIKMLEDPFFAEKRRRMLWGAGLCICMLLQPILSPVSLDRYLRPDYLNDGLYRHLCVLQQTYGLPAKDTHVLVYTHTPYAGFYVQYAFRSSYAKCVGAEQLDKSLIEEKWHYAWLIVTDHDEEIDAVLEKYDLPLDQEVIPLITVDEITGMVSFAVDDAVAQMTAAQGVCDG